jgi:hypothetical protein
LGFGVIGKRYFVISLQHTKSKLPSSVAGF